MEEMTYFHVPNLVPEILYTHAPEQQGTHFIPLLLGFDMSLHHLPQFFPSQQILPIVSTGVKEPQIILGGGSEAACRTPCFLQLG